MTITSGPDSSASVVDRTTSPPSGGASGRGHAPSVDALRRQLEVAHGTASHPNRDVIWATARAIAEFDEEPFVRRAYAEITWDLEHRARDLELDPATARAGGS